MSEIHLITLFLLIACAVIVRASNSIGNLTPYKGVAKIAMVPLLICFMGLFFVLNVPAGHVKSAELFSEAQNVTYEEGLHFPVNPLYTFALYEVQLKSDPSGSQFDISLEYKLVSKNGYRDFRVDGLLSQ